MSMKHFAHDCYHILSTMDIHINYLQKMVQDRNIPFPDVEKRIAAEEKIKRLGDYTRRIKSLLDKNCIIEDIKESQIKVFDRIPIDLLSRLIKEVEEKIGRGIVWYIGYCETKPIYLEKYYLTAINCILENAFEYACPGSIICINLYADKFEISNIGIPIHKDEMNRIFEYGYRGRDATNCNYRGIGSGLYIAKNVYDAYESTLSISSESIVEKNKEVEPLITCLLGSLNKKHLSEYLTEFQYEAARKTIEQICKIYNMNHKAECLYINKTSVKNWLNYWVSTINSENLDFILNKPKAKVTVTILYGKEKENINNRR